MKKILLLTIVSFAFIANSFAQDNWQAVNQTDINELPTEVKDIVVFKDTLYIVKAMGSTQITPEQPMPIIIRSGNGSSGNVNWETVTPTTLTYSPLENASINALAITTLGTGFMYMATLEPTSYSNDGAPVVYRSQNGKTWQRMSDIGFGYEADYALDLIEFNGNVYISSTYVTSSTQSAIFKAAYNENNTANWSLAYNADRDVYGSFTNFYVFKGALYATTDMAYLFKSTDGTNWTDVTAGSPGFGNVDNIIFSAITAHNDSLFVGTQNSVTGPELWKSIDGTNFFKENSTSLTSFTDPGLYSEAINDLRSYNGNLMVSIYRYYMSSGDVIVRSTNGNDYTESYNGNIEVLESYEVKTAVFKNNFYSVGRSPVTEFLLKRVNLTPCAGVPDAGYISGDVNLCSTTLEVTTLTVNGASNAIGIVYAWQESVNNGTTWTDILSGTGFNQMTYVTELVSYTKQYRAKVTCSNSSLSAYTNPVQINLSVLNCYCYSGAEYDDDSKIDSVAFNTINNGSSNTGCASYTNFSHIKTTVHPDSTYLFTVTAGSCSFGYDKITKLFIDYNIDGDFDDVGEEAAVLGPTALTTDVLNYSVTIPSSAIYGETKMRVVLMETQISGDVLACGLYGYGETEDYNIYIIEPIALNSIGTGNYCEASTFVASYTVNNYFNGNEFKLQISNNAGSFANPVVVGSTISTFSGTISATLPATMSAGTYYARVVSTNPATVSDLKTFTILPNPSISGSVFSNAVLATGGKVKIFDYNSVYRMDVQDEVSISAGGTYTFTSLPFGTYIVQAKPTVSGNPGAYFGDVQLWQNATVINVACGTSLSNKNINTNPYSALTGQGTVSGGVYKGINYGSGKTTLMGDPIPGVDVSLEQNPGGIIISVTQTSTITGTALGTYIFSNVPSGTFDVKVDLPGIGMSSIHTATVSGLQDTTHLDYYVDSNSVYIIPATVSIAEKTEIMHQTKVYPNPSVDFVFVETTATENQPADIRLYNSFGQLIYSETTTNNKIRIATQDKLKDGIYFIEITQGSIQSKHKIIITK